MNLSLILCRLLGNDACFACVMKSLRTSASSGEVSCLQEGEMAAIARARLFKSKESLTDNS